jgi:hypothetical protein
MKENPLKNFVANQLDQHQNNERNEGKIKLQKIISKLDNIITKRLNEVYSAESWADRYSASGIQLVAPIYKLKEVFIDPFLRVSWSDNLDQKDLYAAAEQIRDPYLEFKNTVISELIPTAFNELKPLLARQEREKTAAPKALVNGKYDLSEIRLEQRDATTKKVSCAASLTFNTDVGGAKMDIEYTAENTSDGKIYVRVH